MGFGRFGFGSTDDDQPIGFWMDENTDQAAQRDAYAAAGGERWNAATRSGENLDASRPTDLVALGAQTSPGATAVGAEDAPGISVDSAADAPPQGPSGAAPPPASRA